MSISLHSQAVKQFSHLELIARQVVEGFITGLHKSPFHGFSVEFAEHRLFNTGESTRHIDWRLYARTDRLYVKRYEEETNLRCQIVIDASSSMDFPMEDSSRPGQVSKLGFSVYSAAALIHLLKRQRDAFGLSVFADSVGLHTGSRSTQMHAKLMLSELEKLLQRNPGGQGQSAAAAALHEVADKIRRRSLVVIFSDMMENSGQQQDDLWAALQHLRHGKHEVILFHVADRRREFEFDFTNSPHRFIDLETGEELRLNPAEVRDTYRESMRQFNHQLKLRCGQYGIDLVEADIAKPFDQVLLPYLLKRKKML